MDQPTVTTDTLVIERLTRMEEKQDHLLEKLESFNTKSEDHDQRIRGLENSRARAAGIMAVLAGISGITGAQVFEKMFGS